MRVCDGRLTWQPPPGRWQVLVVTRNRLYEGTHAVSNVWDKITYVNINCVLAPDVALVAARAPVRMTHRRIDGHDVYFLINDSPQPWLGRIDFAAAGQAEQ
jgi:hypothetical protein